MAASAGASVLYLSCHRPPGTMSVIAYDGTPLAEHVFNAAFFTCQTLTSGWQDGSLLTVARSGDTLHVCSAGGHLQSVSLGRPAARAELLNVWVSSCDQLAAVCIIGWPPEVTVVDLAQQHVTYRHGPHGLPHELAMLRNSVVLAQSSCHLAVCHCASNNPSDHARGTTWVLAIRGPEQAFVLQKIFSPSWDALGKFLAVAVGEASLSVYTASGTYIASLMPDLLPYPLLLHVQWQPEGTELRCVGRRGGGLQNNRAVWVCRFNPGGGVTSRTRTRTRR